MFIDVDDWNEEIIQLAEQYRKKKRDSMDHSFEKNSSTKTHVTPSDPRKITPSDPRKMTVRTL